MASSYSIEPPPIQPPGASASDIRQVPCPECQSPVLIASKFCEGCGAIFTKRERTTHLLASTEPCEAQPQEAQLLSEDSVLDEHAGPSDFNSDPDSAPGRHTRLRMLKDHYRRAWLFGFWSGLLLPLAWLVPLVTSILDQSSPHGSVRRKAKGVLLGFAVGFSLLVVAILFIWLGLSILSTQHV